MYPHLFWYWFYCCTFHNQHHNAFHSWKMWNLKHEPTYSFILKDTQTIRSLWCVLFSNVFFRFVCIRFDRDVVLAIYFFLVDSFSRFILLFNFKQSVFFFFFIHISFFFDIFFSSSNNANPYSPLLAENPVESSVVTRISLEFDVTFINFLLFRRFPMFCVFPMDHTFVYIM